MFCVNNFIVGEKPRSFLVIECKKAHFIWLVFCNRFLCVLLALQIIGELMADCSKVLGRSA